MALLGGFLLHSLLDLVFEYAGLRVDGRGRIGCSAAQMLV